MSGPNPTIWEPNNHEGELTQDVVDDIADSSGNLLVDVSSNNVVDGGVDFNPIPTTTWIENDTA